MQAHMDALSNVKTSKYKFQVRKRKVPDTHQADCNMGWFRSFVSKLKIKSLRSLSARVRKAAAVAMATLTGNDYTQLMGHWKGLCCLCCVRTQTDVTHRFHTTNNTHEVFTGNPVLVQPGDIQQVCRWVPAEFLSFTILRHFISTSSFGSSSFTFLSFQPQLYICASTFSK